MRKECPGAWPIMQSIRRNPVDASQVMHSGQLRQEALDDETARPVLSTLEIMQAKQLR
jgi:hypothetical protein